MSDDVEREDDGRWIAELDGVMVYGDTREEAIAAAKAIASEVAQRKIMDMYAEIRR